MPTYHYRCAGCEQEFEIKQSIQDAPLTECPIPRTEPSAPEGWLPCGGRVARLITGCAFQLIGRGFHVNDYTRRGIK